MLESLHKNSTLTARAGTTWESFMKRILLALAAAAAIAASVALLPGRAAAMGVGTAAAIDYAVNETSLLEQTAYVCRHRWRTSRRVCWWTTPHRIYRPYRYYYRPYRTYRRWHW
jgi:hypothetical protein